MLKQTLIYLILSVFPTVNGSCSKWTCWTPCSVTCGSGSQERRRTCHNPARAKFRPNCLGSRSESRPCTVTACPIAGNWGNWRDWSPCPVTCGGGRQVKIRACDNPAPGNNGSDCKGSDSESRTCAPIPCPINGNWAEWSLWSKCSLTCGQGGKRIRKRTCDNPAPAYNGRDCSGSDSDEELCILNNCPINGNWTEWSLWSICSLTCGEGGGRIRKRTCDNPAPANNGQNCSGSDSDEELCILNDCPINGNWAEWSLWSKCSLTCGQGGKRIRKRTCDNPAPANNGRDCSGSDSDEELCILNDCPINGNWTEWSLWSICSLTCGEGGGRIRKRTCDNPAPANNGQNCSGSDSDEELCILNDCPINGNWTEWSLWSICSLTCGEGGGRIRKRTCDNPAPANNGQNCSGSDSDEELCILNDCPINGNWTEWSLWSICSLTCGEGGGRIRKRTCDNPAPANNGQNCSGSDSDEELCILNDCPINGNWTEWSLWSICSLTCGEGGGRIRKRTCDNPAPANNGQNCSGSDSDEELCILNDCPKRIKKRACDNPAPANNGLECSGSGSEDEICSLPDCPINGNWAEWSLWSKCSISCGSDGNRFRDRTCSNPEAANGGRSCTGRGIQAEICELPGCPI